MTRAAPLPCNCGGHSVRAGGTGGTARSENSPHQRGGGLGVDKGFCLRNKLAEQNTEGGQVGGK